MLSPVSHTDIGAMLNHSCQPLSWISSSFVQCQPPARSTTFASVFSHLRDYISFFKGRHHSCFISFLIPNIGPGIPEVTNKCVLNE